MTRHTLLLVDSDTQHARVIEVSLRKSGYEVVVLDGADALAKIESETVDDHQRSRYAQHVRPRAVCTARGEPTCEFLCVSDRRQPDRLKVKVLKRARTII